MKSLLTALVAIAMLVLVPTSAMAYTPASGAVFNRPTGSPDQVWAIINHIRQTIASTPKGATIEISTYLLDHAITTDELVKAHRRGVNVHVVVDADVQTPQSDRLKNVFGAPRRAGQGRSWIVFCKGSCRGVSGTSNMHAKFYTFSRAGSATNVVMVSSANLNRGGATNGWNDLATIANRPDVYAKFHQIFTEMALDKPALTPYESDDFGDVETRFFPKIDATQATDPTYQDLRKVKCLGASAGAGKNGHTVINVAMFWWSDARGEYLARQLVDLDNRGCNVNIAYGAPAARVAAILRASARAGGVTLYDTRYDRNGDGIMDLRVHSKYMTVSGVYAGNASTRRVWTGSQNWVLGSLTKGDELTVSLDDPAVYGAYLSNFRDVTVNGARRVLTKAALAK